MKCDALTRTTGKAWISGARGTMASSGRLLGLQLPPPPSHLAVRSPHTTTSDDDDKECCSLEPLFPPLARTHSDTSEFQAPSLDAQPEKPAETKERPTTEDEDASEGQTSTHSPPGFGLRSKLTSMLSVEKRVSLHSHNMMMEMAGFPRRAPQLADSKLCAAIQKESFARMFDLYDDARCYSAPGAYSGVGRACENVHGDMGVRADLAWMDDKGNDAWGTEPWHSDQRSILMKTLHIMRCDIESLKTMLRSLDLPAARGGPLDPHLHETLGYTPYTHPGMMRSHSAMAELKQPSHEQAVDSLKEDKDLAQAAEKEPHESVDKDLGDKELLEVPPPEKEEPEESISTWSHGCPKRRRQWWRELLAAFGLTVWVITGAVLVAKAIGVPNLGVTHHVAYNGFWGRSDDEETKTPVQGAMGVVELSGYTFNDTIKKRPTFVMFYAPWCPHCQRLHPTWTQLAGVLNQKGYNVQLATVDATKHARLADQYEVPGFPTLIMFKDGKPVGRHRGARNIDTLMSFIYSNK